MMKKIILLLLVLTTIIIIFTLYLTRPNLSLGKPDTIEVIFNENTLTFSSRNYEYFKIRKLLQKSIYETQNFFVPEDERLIAGMGEYIEYTCDDVGIKLTYTKPIKFLEKKVFDIYVCLRDNYPFLFISTEQNGLYEPSGYRLEPNSDLIIYINNLIHEYKVNSAGPRDKLIISNCTCRRASVEQPITADL